jgi:hypothetical protein
MPLFIDRLPFRSWTDQTRTPPLTYAAILLPVWLTDPGLAAPGSNSQLQEWVLDTGNTGEGFGWRHHLVQAGLDPDAHRLPGHIRIAGSAIQQPSRASLTEADFWLASNLAAFHSKPFRIRMERGLPFLDLPTRPDPLFNRPLIGMRSLRRAGLRVEIDFAADVVSVWTP